MSDTLKVLGQQAPAGTTIHTRTRKGGNTVITYNSIFPIIS